MLVATALPRKFIFKDSHNQNIELADPSENYSPETVLNFYAQTYPLLTTAKIEGPEIVDDSAQYRFVLTIGTKG